MRAPAWPMDLQVAEQGRWDWLLLGLVAALSLFGVVAVYSASIAYVHTQFGFEAHYLLRQVFYLGVGATCMAVLCHWPMESWRRLTPLLLGLAFVLLVLVLIPGIGHVANNAARWLSFGPIRFQPSEAAKLRSLLPASAVLWENDCGDSIAGGCDAGRPACEKPLDRFPDALDWVSIDMYDGYAR